jgi:anaphase-promoting complex subunit 6
MCHLRGIIHLQLLATERAKDCFIEALSVDVKCYDSFEALIQANLMEVDEEWEFIQGLAYGAQTEEDAEFVKMVYTVRLRKVCNTVSHPSKWLKRERN